MFIVDTDVLIWYLRGNKKAFKTIESLESFSLSVITYMELVQGMRNKEELNSLRQALQAWKASILYITEEISAKAMFAVAHGLTLLTGNDKHYKIMKGVQIKKFRP